MKTNYETIVRATIKMSNASDESAKYAISAEVQMEGANVAQINEGRVMLGDAEVAAFHKWGNTRLSVSFESADVEIKQAILAEIDAFIASASTKVSVEPISL